MNLADFIDTAYAAYTQKFGDDAAYAEPRSRKTLDEWFRSGEVVFHLRPNAGQCSFLNELWRLGKHQVWEFCCQTNDEHHIKFGRFLSGHELEAILVGAKPDHPEFRALPHATRQRIAQAVAKAYVELARRQGLDEEDCLKRRDPNNIYFFDPLHLNRGGIVLPKLGVVLLSEESERLCHLVEARVRLKRSAVAWLNKGEWLLKFQFEYMSKKAAERRNEQRQVKEQDKRAERSILREEALAAGSRVFRFRNRIPSADILAELSKAGIQLQARELAKLLQEVGVPAPREMWVKGRGVVRGYESADLVTAWKYCQENGYGRKEEPHCDEENS